MSFTNDDDKDGLAALFGGVTPQGEQAPPARGRRAAVPPQPASPDAEPPTFEDTTGAPSAPAATPSAPMAEPPASIPPAYGTPPADPPVYQAPTSSAPAYQPPTYGTPPSDPPTYQAPVYSPPVYQPPVYQAPVSPGYDEPNPSTPRAPEAPHSAPSEPQRPAWQQPASPSPSADQPPVAPFSAPVSPGYHLPPPAEEASRPIEPEPSRPADTTTYPGLAPATPSPTTQYPTGSPFGAVPAFPSDPAAPPAAAGFEPPAQPRSSYDPPVGHPATPDPAAPAPAAPVATPALSEPVAPEPLSEPPAFGGGFAALGLDPTTHEVRPEEAPRSAEPVVEAGFPVSAAPASAPTAPAAAAVEPAPRNGGAVPALRLPPGPLLPADDAPPITEPDELARPTLLEKIGLAAAVLTGPIGLILAIVTAVLGVRRRGWLIAIGRASLVLAVVSTIAAVIGGVVLWNMRVAQLEHAEVAAASADFCAAGREFPEIVEPPRLGWPAPGATITESLTAMQEWTARWTELAATSPDQLASGMQQLAARGEEIIAAVESSRLVDDEANRALIEATVAPSGVAGWYDTYCVAP